MNKINLKYLVLFMITICASLSLSSKETFSSSVNNQESYIIVIDDKESGINLKNDIENEFPDLDIEYIENINVLMINNYKVNYKLEKYLSYKSSAIETKGSSETFNSKPLGLSSHVNPKSIDASTSESFQRSLNNKYDEYRWDIDKVTENGKSYEIQQGNDVVKVGVIDSGVDFNHPDLKDNMGSSKSFVPNKDNIQDDYGHGTMVAGVIAAKGNLKGVSPKIKIHSYKVFDGYSSNSNWLINAIVGAVDDGMDVINISLGTYKSMINKDDLATIIAYKRAVRYATSKNCLIVASAGTEEKGYDLSNPRNLARQRGYYDDLQVHLPGGGVKRVITVSASNKLNQISSYSNYGNSINISSPSGDYGPRWESEGIVSIDHLLLVAHPTNLPQSELSKMMGFENGYEFSLGGTSLAAPKVTATVALIMSEYYEKHGVKPRIRNIENILYKSSIPMDNPRYFGRGTVNAYKALRNVR